MYTITIKNICLVFNIIDSLNKLLYFESKTIDNYKSENITLKC